jgi:hypothetical protein
MLELCTDENERAILEAKCEVLYEVSFKDIFKKIIDFIKFIKNRVKELLHNFLSFIKKVFSSPLKNDPENKSKRIVRVHGKMDKATLKRIVDDMKNGKLKDHYYNEASDSKEYDGGLYLDIIKAANNPLLYYNIEDVIDFNSDFKLNFDKYKSLIMKLSTDTSDANIESTYDSINKFTNGYTIQQGSMSKVLYAEIGKLIGHEPLKPLVSKGIDDISLRRLNTEFIDNVWELFERINEVCNDKVVNKLKKYIKDIDSCCDSLTKATEDAKAALSNKHFESYDKFDQIIKDYKYGVQMLNIEKDILEAALVKFNESAKFAVQMKNTFKMKNIVKL